MGAAKRRTELGVMPEQSQKPRKRARMKADPIGMMDFGGTMALLSSLLMRSKYARMNRERDLNPCIESNELHSIEDAEADT